MEQFKYYNLEKEKIKEELESCKKVILELQNYELNVSDGIKKIDDALETIDKDIIRIVLVGAFSDGKTSCLAGWLGKKMADMNIDISESSNEIEIYKPQNLDEECEIVDTPGLFGSKADENTNEKWSDKTIKYISEAHIIFYVVDANIPLKESHSKIAEYIIKEKLNNTVFIINKMDDVSDIEDDEDFQRARDIKIENLQERLIEFFNLSQKDIENIPIVCISSDPYMKKMDYWLKPENIEQYKNKSRIDSLNEAAKIILTRETRNNIINKTNIIIIADIIRKNAEQVESWLENKKFQYEQAEEELKSLKTDLKYNEQEVKSKLRSLNEEFRNMENSLLNRLRSCTNYEQINNFLMDDIGYIKDKKEIGHKITQDISNKINEFTDNIISISDEILEKFDKSLEKTFSFIKVGLNMGLQNNIKGAKIDENTVSLVKSIFKKEEIKKKTFIDSIKSIFKRNNVINENQRIADGLTKAMPYVGIGVEFVMLAASGAIESHQEKKLLKYREDIENIISQIFKKVYDKLNNIDNSFDEYFPNIKEAQNIIDIQINDKNELENEIRNIENWKKKAFVLNYLE